MKTDSRYTMGLGVFFFICLGLVLVAPKASRADSLGPSSTDTSTENVCDPKVYTGEKKWLDLEVKPEMDNISFKCAAALKTLKPEEDYVFQTEKCDQKQALTEACPGAKLDRKQAAQDTYSLTLSTKPTQDKVLYYKCEATPSRAKGGEELVAGKECIVKITVKGVGPATVVPAAHICVPKETGKDSRNVKELTLEGDKQSIDFSCGKQANTQLTPAANLNKFCADEGCQDQKDLSTVWSDAALTESTAGDATSYTLSVKSERSEDKSIYYKCSAPVEQQTEKQQAEATSQEKSCVLKITVKSDELSLAPAWMALSACLVGQIMLGLLYL
ncbi:hypothetical protein BESB_034180 [Besnoitia besnoiti]|uniref:SRS domain-containing protein n=1 Tax=Besnoitia besnoiti TaxID=94643 RepID=A0A2A9MMX1_BESBE|nr:hypothetical protein BESB_034180 [Besnoitia besnoiti]PFH36960.1 hypothetical protein BESB_034180 [Besnoitia besnoiti]